jgi:hypothetical protein
MEKNLLKKWIDENNIDTEGLPKTWAEANTIMREAYTPIDAMSIAELETFAKNGNHKVYIAVYANCLLKARNTGNYVEVNRFRHKIGMDALI